MNLCIVKPGARRAWFLEITFIAGMYVCVYARVCVCVCVCVCVYTPKAINN